MTIGLVDQSYSYSFDVKDGWADWGFEDNIFRVTGGRLPAGVGLTTEGRIIGTPTELGPFDFRVTVYDLNNDNAFEDQNTNQDSEWFTLFVTESSTHPDCASPAEADLTEIYLCLGELSTDEYREAADNLSLDVNFYVNLAQSKQYRLWDIEFTIEYDAGALRFDPKKMNSSRLRESAKLAEATIEFDLDQPGKLTVTLAATGQGFVRSGRLMDLPLVAQKDLDEELYLFTLSGVNFVAKDRDLELPEIVTMDGLLEVTNPADNTTEPDNATES